MPLVHIDLIEGRSEEQLKGLVKDVTAAISKNANRRHDGQRQVNKSHPEISSQVAFLKG